MGLSELLNESDLLGNAYEYLIGQFAAGSGKKAGEFYTPQQISTILSRIVILDSQNPSVGKKSILTICGFRLRFRITSNQRKKAS